MKVRIAEVSNSEGERYTFAPIEVDRDFYTFAMGKHIAELEEELKLADEGLDFWQKNYTALRDGLRELYEGSVQYQEFRSVYDGSLPVDPNVYLKIKRDDVLALLGKESEE